jgi:succinate dehydrogenase / fumarate reductase cytochrome b subunit
VSQTTEIALEDVRSAAWGGSFLLKRLHSLTGLIFGGYIVVHLLVNATLLQGGTGANDIYQLQVDKIHALPFLWAVEWVFIFLPIIYHSLYGAWITFEGQPNVEKYPYARNYFYIAQRISAGVIVLFILFHVLGMKGWLGNTLQFVPEDAARSTARHINASLWLAYFVYPIGIIASCFHLANGFSTAGITWGLTISAHSQKRWGYICAGLFVFTLLCGFLALGAAIHDRALLVH